MARLLAPHMAQALGQNVVVDNKPGASGQLAAGQVARATPDGSQLLLDASSFAVNPSLFPKLPYDTATAFTPLAVLALFPNVLVCTPSYEAKSVRDVVRAGQGEAGADRLCVVRQRFGAAPGRRAVRAAAGVSLVHVPYKGGGPALNDVMGGQVPLFFANVASSLGHIQGGKLRPLAVTSRRRARALPEVPTMEEAGVAGYEVLEWNPVLAPAGISPALRPARRAIRKAMAEPEVLGRVRSLSGEVFEGNEARAAEFLKKQQALWARVVRDRKISAG
jgi:tripartite-type tricarboxylate transporter receptor subunit TctC